ncbi:hypothetical protein RRG08_041124 [Elysia crispata]|uniref:Uncharacterized protein n=1 Tax=Elysia crispata TaxID=231223 RepID=A0AAE0XY78_9GAST|nr:hypothetical protein RRG08_041124 [Elysia crispata]
MALRHRGNFPPSLRSRDMLGGSMAHIGPEPSAGLPPATPTTIEQTFPEVSMFEEIANLTSHYGNIQSRSKQKELERASAEQHSYVTLLPNCAALSAAAGRRGLELMILNSAFVPKSQLLLGGQEPLRSKQRKAPNQRGRAKNLYEVNREKPLIKEGGPRTFTKQTEKSPKSKREGQEPLRSKQRKAPNQRGRAKNLYEVNREKPQIKEGGPRTFTKFCKLLICFVTKTWCPFAMNVMGFGERGRRLVCGVCCQNFLSHSQTRHQRNSCLNHPTPSLPEIFSSSKFSLHQFNLKAARPPRVDDSAASTMRSYSVKQSNGDDSAASTMRSYSVKQSNGDDSAASTMRSYSVKQSNGDDSAASTVRSYSVKQSNGDDSAASTVRSYSVKQSNGDDSAASTVRSYSVKQSNGDDSAASTVRSYSVKQSNGDDSAASTMSSYSVKQSNGDDSAASTVRSYSVKQSNGDDSAASTICAPIV